jgi:hypothetical protein
MIVNELVLVVKIACCNNVKVGMPCMSCRFGSYAVLPQCHVTRACANQTLLHLPLKCEFEVVTFSDGRCHGDFNI